MPLEPAPIRIRPKRTPKRVPVQTYPALREEKLPTSLLAGAGVVASISTASVLQFLFPALRFGGVPVGAAVGLLLGWTFACPFVWVLARVLDRARPAQVLAAASAVGLVLALPALFFAHSLGWSESPIAIVALGILLSGSGLVWGGYLDFDNPADF